MEELLAAGIDVWTTLNIQHVESLNDVVARITRIRVRETVPDGVIDRADEIIAGSCVAQGGQFVNERVAAARKAQG